MKNPLVLNRPYELSVPIPTSGTGLHSRRFNGEFVHEASNTRLSVNGFTTQDNLGVIRYSLPQEGEWTYIVRGDWADQPLSTGIVTCVSTNDTRYPLEVTSTRVRPLFTKNREPFFMSTYECNWLFALWMTDEQEAKRFLDVIKKYRFNAICMNIYAHACSWTIPGTPGRLVPPPLFNWGGSNEAPDFQTMNSEFYARFDALMEYLYHLDIVAHLYFFVWNKGNSYPAAGSAEESDYISYIVRRYQAYPNIIWDYCKEAYLRLDKDHIRRMLELIRTEDAYQRLLTVHDDKLIQYDESFDHLLDFHTMQVHHEYFSKTLREIEKRKKPVFTAEYTYEAGVDLLDRTFQDSHSYEEYMLASWELALAGSPVCYYYTFTSWDVIRTADVPRGYAGFEFLARFFDSFDWWNYSAVPESNTMVRTIIACAKHVEKSQFVLLTDKHGRFGLLVDMAQYRLEGEWIDIYSGERRVMQPGDFTHIYNSEITFAICPFGERYGNLSHYIARFELKGSLDAT